MLAHLKMENNHIKIQKRFTIKLQHEWWFLCVFPSRPNFRLERDFSLSKTTRNYGVKKLSACSLTFNQACAAPCFFILTYYAVVHIEYSLRWMSNVVDITNPGDVLCSFRKWGQEVNVLRAMVIRLYISQYKLDHIFIQIIACNTLLL